MATFRGQVYSGQYIRDGLIATSDISAALIYDHESNINGFRGIGRDVTEKVKLEEHLKYASLHDELTGPCNRRYFENELARLRRSREHPVAVISADLGGLKLINDTFGHSEGDLYLQAGLKAARKKGMGWQFSAPGKSVFQSILYHF